MEKIKNKKQLLEKLKKDIKESKQKEIVFLAGHFPIIYLKEEKKAIESFQYWGNFSLFSLELACVLGKYAVCQNKKVSFVFFVDDHAYEEISGLNPRDRSKRRDNLYKIRSGEKAVLNPEYGKILNKYGFSEKNVLRHDHGKDGRNSCLYFSEKILRESSKKISNACAREYVEFIENSKYFNKKRKYLIAFVPNRCMGHICNVALDSEIKNINSSHVFIETLMTSGTEDDLFEKGRGVSYRQDLSLI